MKKRDLNLRAAWGVAAIFALVGSGISGWAVRIPAIKFTLHLSSGQIGLLLTCATFGSILGLISAGRAHRFFSAARIIVAGFAIWAVGAITLGFGTDLVHSPLMVAAGMILIGFGSGCADVSMNVEGAHVEQQMRSPIMPRLHAAFSAGTVAMTLLGVGIVYLQIPVWLNMLGLVAVVVPAALAAVRLFLPEDREMKAANHSASKASGRSGWREGRTIAIGIMVMLFSVTEGSANDWLALAMVEGHGAPQWVGIAILTAFMSAMMLGRLAGTMALARFGRVTCLRVTALLAIAGSLLIVFGPLWLAPLAAIMWGLGASLGFPVGMSAAADDPVRAAGRVSTVGVIAYTAFLGGPPLIGAIANHVGTLNALLVTGLLATIALFFIPATRPLTKNQ